MKINQLRLLSVLVVATSLVACGGSSGSKIKETVEENVREYEVNEVSSAIDEIMKADKEPGMSVALIANNKIVFSGGFGVSNIESGTAVTADTSFWLGSVSKSVIGVALMQAQEQGVLSLEDHVPTLLANDNNVKVTLPHTYPLLLNHLATHTSGITDADVYECAYFVGDELGERYSLVNALQDGDCDETAPVDLSGYLNAYLSDSGVFYSQEDNFLDVEPGATFEYSNIGAALAGYAIESQTGTSLADYADTHIFQPLAMDNTSWKLSELNLANLATPHVWDGEAMMPLPVYSLATWPDGGLRSSANDLAKYLLAVANNGELPANAPMDGSMPNTVRILEEESVDTLLAPQVDSGEGFAMGVFWATLQLPSGRFLVGHDGSDPGAYSYMFFDPEKNVGVVMIGNGDDEFSDDFNERHYLLIDQLMDHAETLGDL